MKRSEYETQAAAFRALLIAEGAKPQAEQNWPEFGDWLSVEGTSTCTTPTCEVYGQPFSVTFHENADGIYRAQCGLCFQATATLLTLEEG